MFIERSAKMPAHNKILILIALFGFSHQAFAKSKKNLQFEMNYNAGWIYDPNIADNYLEVSKSYFSPEWGFQLDLPINKKSTIRSSHHFIYQNYVEERPPVIAAPFYTGDLTYDYQIIKKNQMGLQFTYAESRAPEWELIKIKYRARLKYALKSKKYLLSLQTTFDVENYGNSLQDGYTYWYELNYSRRLVKWSKKNHLKLDLSTEIENRRSNGELYTYLRYSETIQFAYRYSLFDFRIGYQYAYKDYSWLFYTQEHNYEYKFAHLHAPLLKVRAFLSKSYWFYLYYKREFYQSNQTSYNFNDGYFKAGIAGSIRLK